MTSTQARIVRFVREFWDQHGYAPTIREIVKGTGLSSPGSVSYQVKRLQLAGLFANVEGDGKKARTIRLAPESPERRGEVDEIPASRTHVHAERR